MRPHLLELEAFMAFPGRVRLDLDDLAQSGLLLLCGDTGGGKTTLLDALGFALYGVVPGERAKAKEDLRSHHAPSGARAWVRLEFTARGRRLRVTREPAQERPKARGTGTVKEQPTALLEERAGGQWVPVAQRNDDVGLEIGRLLGMDAGQFFQVVMLPQGRFAAFLQAEHKEREKLLKQLFHVDRFERAEGWLGERAAEAGRRLDAARAELAAVAARVAQEAGVEPPEPVEEAPAWAAELSDRSERECSVLADGVQRLARARADAERAVVEAEGVAARQAARRAAEAELAVLEARRPEIEVLAVELDSARRAAPVVLAARTADLRVRQAARAQQEQAAARGRLSALGGAADLPVPDLRAAAGALRTEQGRLDGLREVLDRARASGRAAAASGALATRLAEQARAAERRSGTELPAARAQARTRAERARRAERALPQRTAERDRRAARAALADELARVRAAGPGLLVAAERADAVAEQAREALGELREQRLEAIRYELAAMLVDGDPCPVCGALEHPEISEVRADHVSRDAEREAERTAERLRREAGQAAQALALHEARAAELEQRLAAAGDAEPLAEVDAEIRELTAGAADLAAAEELVRDLQGEAERLGTALARLHAEAEQATRRAHEQAQEAAELERRIAEDLGDGVDLPTRLREVQTLADANDAAAELAAAALVEAEAAHDAERTSAALAQAAGLASVLAAQRAARDEAWQRQVASRLQSFDRELSGVHGRLASAELAVALEPDAPVGAARAQLQQARDSHEQALARERVAAERAEQLAKLVPSYELACEVVPGLRAAAGELRVLADLAAGRGGNRLSMTLSTFVLAARLEEVADAASQRLARMSGGRYLLVHSDTGRDKRQRAGLGLQVEDAWTGRRRDTATLSGGETFMTALALALGLADVVTAEAGGQSIDALFVDEGFGTLDADSLDQVMDVLDELRSGGRLVGIVSHVADLRQRIPAQVRVVKGTQGSTVRTTST